MKNIEPVLKFLSQLGLDFFESKVYILLLENGPMTILQISRESKINRTGIYRLVEKLQGMGILEEIIRDGKKLILSSPLNKLELIVKEQEAKAETLRKMLPEISSLITSEVVTSQPGTKVQFYKGPEGIKQMVWNNLKSHGEVVGYTFRDLAEVVGIDFAENWKREFIFRKLRFRDIIGDEYLKTKTLEDVKISNIASNFETKYMNPDVLNITHQVDIYDDVIAYYSWYDEEVFGVEIYNAKIAKLQKQLFEIAWNSAELL